MDAAAALSREFFELYARGRSALDIDLIASQYEDAFLFAGPRGARVTQKAAVLSALPKAQELLNTHGHTSTQVVSVDETWLDEHYLLARVQFAWRFEKLAAPPIDVNVESTFILYLNQGAFTIVFQLEHEDFHQALRARGVLPAAS